MDLTMMALIASCVAGAVATAFLIEYMVLAPWWKSQVGKNVVLLTAIIIVAAALAIVGRLGWVEVARVGSVVVWFGVAAVYVWRIWMLAKAQHAGRILRRMRQREKRG